MPSQRPTSSFPVSLPAVGFMLGSTLCFTIMNTLIRYVSDYPVFQLVFFRALGSVFFCFFLLKRYQIPIKGNNPKWLIARGITGVTSMSLFYLALKIMPMGTAVSLRYLSPFFAAGMAIYFLKEKMRPIQWLFFLVAFIGVVILKGFEARLSGFGLMVIMASAVISGMVYIIIRKIGTTEHPIVVVTYFMIITLILGGIGCLFSWLTPSGTDWLILLSLGFFGYYAQYFMTKALQVEAANRIVPLKYSEVIFTLIAAWVVFGEAQSLIALGAMALIIFALIANVSVKQKG